MAWIVAIVVCGAWEGSHENSGETVMLTDTQSVDGERTHMFVKTDVSSNEETFRDKAGGNYVGKARADTIGQHTFLAHLHTAATTEFAEEIGALRGAFVDIPGIEEASDLVKLFTAGGICFTPVVKGT
jgi:hypothetical protein